MKYVKAMAEVVQFDNSDVITTSSGNAGQGEGDNKCSGPNFSNPNCWLNITTVEIGCNWTNSQMDENPDENPIAP